ncbi:MAG: hypothetical protein ACEY3G_03260 [Arsenophonus sp.]
MKSIFNPLEGNIILAMKTLRQRFTIDEIYSYCYEGYSEKIPEIYDKLHAGILVLSVLGKTDISAEFLYKTGE